MPELILDGSGPGVRAVLVGRGARDVGRAGALAAAVAALLAEHGVAPSALTAIIGMVGPGSFTGLRAALALGHGLGAASGRPLVAVAAAEALARLFPATTLLAAFATGRAGRFALQRIDAGGTAFAPAPFSADGPLPDIPPGAVLAGPAAAAIARLLDAAGRVPPPLGPAQPPETAVAAVAAARMAGRIAPRAPIPIYADDLFATRR